MPLKAYTARYAVVAQLVEHLHGKEKVCGSIPHNGSRKQHPDRVLFFCLTMIRIADIIEPELYFGKFELGDYMSIIAEEIQIVVKKQDEAAQKGDEAQGAYKEVNGQWKLIRDKIKQGESSGDSIRDFAIVRYGYPMEKYEETYRLIDERVKLHNGEFVLMIERSESLHGCFGMGATATNDDYHVDTYFYLGLIDGTGLEIDPPNGNCSIPTKGVVSLGKFRDGVELSTQKISSTYLRDFAFLNQTLEPRNPMYRFRKEEFKVLELIIGDAEVKEWFSTEPTSSLMVFQSAARLLGRDITAEFPALIAKEEEKKRDVRTQLLGLQYQYEGIKQKIGQAELAKQETELVKLNESLTKKIEQIKAQIKIALELGLADTQLLTVPQLCEEFGVEAP